MPNARLRRADASGPGIRRKRSGRGFAYFDDEGTRVKEREVLERIAELGIPPAWKNVWICPYPNGHLQATGEDAAGRKQYLYHQKWRERRDQEKFDDMVRFARALPGLRDQVAAALGHGNTLSRDRVLACSIRLLDRGFFRIGSEDYAVRNETYGLATMRKEHVKIEDDKTMVFDYVAKASKRQVRAVIDPETCDVVAKLRRRRTGGDELLAWREGGEWRDVKSADINLVIKEWTGEDFSAKDFRTWNATVLAAVALAASSAVAGGQGSPTARKKAVARAIKEVSYYLGNTPAVCRASYVDPRVIDAFHAGLTVAPVLTRLGDDSHDDLPIHQRRVEKGVLDLIAGDEEASGVALAA